MVHLITEIGKLLNILLIAFYTFLSLRAITVKSESKKKSIYKWMTVLFFILHFDINLQLYVCTEDIGIIIFYAAQLAIYILVQILYSRCYHNMSKPVFRNMMFLLMLGICEITRLDLMTALKQFFFMTAILAAGLVIPVMIEKLEMWSRLGLLYVAIGLLVMIFLLLTGSEVNGATNWIVIGGFKFQPSEFVKLLFVFGMSALLAKSTKFSNVALTTALAAAHVIVLVLEKDLGAALIFFITYMVIMYVATRKGLYLGAGLLAFAAAAVAAYYLFAHVRVRVEAYFDPLASYETSGYQVSQSLFAIGSGSWFGMGIYQGSSTTIPVAESDFIFSAISEEMGGIFAICLILIMLSIFIMFINISVKIENRFFKLVSLGFGTLYITQVFVNIAGVTKFLPSSGVTLPLVSAGGSSLIASVIMFNVIQGMYCKAQLQGAVNSTEEAEILLKSSTLKRTFGVTYFFIAVFIMMIGFYGFFIQVKSHDFCLDSRNARQGLLAASVIRGEIRSSDGKILARTVSEDGKENREYPYGRMFCHVVGRNEHGRTGVELYGNSELLSSDINGIKKIENDLNEVKNPGNVVVTTLDYDLQKAAYDALGDNKGAVVVLEPSTGKVLAMVSKPDYDPGKVSDNWTALSADENGYHRLLNRATQGLYQPGSTFKILTLLEYVRENRNYNRFEYTCEGTQRENNVTIHCAAGLVHGEEDLKTAFANSCNSAFTKIGCSLEMKRMKELAESFLFNGKLPGVFGPTSGSFALSEKSDPIDIPQSIIGLSTTLVTPMQNAVIASIIANDGVMMVPYVVDHVENADGARLTTAKPIMLNRVISEEEAELLTEYMEAVVDNGTGSKLDALSINVAGKTGTATYDSDANAHAWFIGFAPAEAPEIAISVVVESAGSGSKYAVPVAKKVLEAYEKKHS